MGLVQGKSEVSTTAVDKITELTDACADPELTARRCIFDIVIDNTPMLDKMEITVALHQACTHALQA